MSLYIIDVESDGGIIGKHSMVCFGAVKLDWELQTTFYGKTKPVSPEYLPEALAVSGFSRTEHLTFEEPEKVFKDFGEWIEVTNANGRPIFLSDNNGYDASWINWYFLTFCGKNPFGYSSRRITDLWCGYKNNLKENWKPFRSKPFTDKNGRYHKGYKHSHNPVDDALGNAHALLYMINEGLNINI